MTAFRAKAWLVMRKHVSMRCCHIRNVLVAIVLSAAAPLSGQMFGEHLDVRVIQVPVVVYRGTDVVADLTRDDFVLFVNGEPQPIAYFDVINFERGASDRSKAGDIALEQRRLTLLLFDLPSVSPIELTRARPAIENLVARSSPSDLFAVAVYDGRRARYIAPFSRDKAVAVRAVATLRPGVSGDPLGLAITAAERTASSAFAAPGVVPGRLEEGYSAEVLGGLDDLERTIEGLAGRRTLSAQTAVEKDREFSQQVTADSWMNALEKVADDLAPLQGIKQVTLFSTGTALGDFGSICAGAEGTRGLGQSFFCAGVVGSSQVRERTNEHFRRAGITLDIVDVGGLQAPSSASGRSPAPNPTTSPALFTTALGTGGRVLYGSGVATLLRVYSDTRRVNYLLGFRPPAHERDHNQIVVKLKNPRWLTSLSYRRGYSRVANDSKDVSSVLLADAMLNDIALNDVSVTLSTDPGGAIEVGVPGSELLALAVDGRVTVAFYVYVFDAAGEVVGWKVRKMDIDEEKARVPLAGKELVRRERFALPPGRYTVKALVHVIQRDLLTSRKKVFDISAPNADVTPAARRGIE